MKSTEDGAVLDLRDDLTELLRDPVSAEQLVQWCIYARNRDPVVFVGAGMSLNAVMKTGQRGALPLLWPALDDRMKSALPAVEQAASIDPLWRAELFERMHTRARLIHLLRDAIAVDRVDPGDPHVVLMRGPWSAILTTNYDDLLERASEQTGSTWARAWDDQQLTAPVGRRAVLHVHGVIDVPESVVLTLEDYRRFPMKRPGMLTKVRQLFLERPVLMVGFSATDPNFIQWSGWVEDVMGRSRPPMVSLHVGKPISAPRVAYWSGNLHFVPVEVAQFSAVLETINRFLSPAAASEHMDPIQEVRRRLQGKERAEDLVELLWRWWDRVTEAQGMRGAEYQRRLALEATCRRALHLLMRREAEGRGVPFDEDAIDREIQKLQKISKEEHLRNEENSRIAAPMRRDAPTLDLLPNGEKHDRLRLAFGSMWFSLVDGLFKRDLLMDLLLFDPDRPVYRVGCGFQVWACQYDYQEEAQRARVADPDAWAKLPKEVKRKLDWKEVLRRVNEESDDGGRVSFEATHGPLATDEDSAWNAAVRRLQWISGQNAQPPPDPKTAAEWRQVGFFAVLAGDAHNAWKAYSTAADRSRKEVEPPDVEHATLQSALHAGGDQSMETMHSLDLRVRQLVHERSAAATWYEDDLHRSQSAELKDLLKYAVQGPYVTTGHANRGGVAAALDWVERIWVHPGLISRYAALSSAALCRSSHPVDAVRLALRYGDKQVAQLVAHICGGADVGARPQDISAAWTIAYQGPWALRARARAAVAWTPHAPETWLSTAKEIWQRTLASASDSPRWPSGSRADGDPIVTTYSDLVPLTIARWKVSPPDVVCDEWGTVWPKLSLRTEVKELLDGVAALPFVQWVQRDLLSQDEAVSFLVQVLQACERHRAAPTGFLRSARWRLMIVLADCVGIGPDDHVPPQLGAWLKESKDHAADAAARHSMYVRFLEPAETALAALCSTDSTDEDRLSAWEFFYAKHDWGWLPELHPRLRQALDHAVERLPLLDDSLRPWMVQALSVAVCRLHAAATDDSASFHVAWRRLLDEHPNAMFEIGSAVFPDSWWDDHVEEQLRLMLLSPATQEGRFGSRRDIAVMALSRLARHLPSKVLPLLDLIVIELRDADAGRASRVVHVLQDLGRGLITTGFDGWKRWLPLFEAAAADERTTMRVAVAEGLAWLAHDARGRSLPVSALAALHDLHERLQQDDRLSVLAAIRGVRLPPLTED